MSDVAEQVEVEAKAAADAENATDGPTVEKLMAEINEIRSAQSGSDRKVKELSDALTAKEAEAEELRTQAMSDKERLEYEKARVNEERAELAKERQARYIADGIAESKLDPGVRKLMTTPTTPEEVAAWMEVYEGLQAPHIERQVNERLSGTPPKSGKPATPGKKLETFEDGRNATDEEFAAYLASEITDEE